MKTELRDSFTNGYDYTIGIKEIMAIPIELPKWAKVSPAVYGEDNVLITPEQDSGEYYSMLDVSAALGKAFTPIPYLKDGYGLAHYSYDFHERTDMIEFLVGKEITLASGETVVIKCMNFLEDGITPVHVEDIDFPAIGNNEFGIFSAREIKSVPKQIPVEEEQEA